MQRKILTALFATALICAGQVLAADKPPVDANAAFDQQYKDIQAALADGKTYAEISNQDKATVRAALDRMQGRLQKAGSVDALGTEDRVATFNDQEVVNTILTKAAADSRQICTRERPTGTRHAQTSCFTVAERRRQQDKADTDLRNIQRPSAIRPAGGSR